MEVMMVPQAETVIEEGAASKEKKAFVVTMVTRDQLDRTGSQERTGNRAILELLENTAQ